MQHALFLHAFHPPTRTSQHALINMHFTRADTQTRILPIASLNRPKRVWLNTAMAATSPQRQQRHYNGDVAIMPYLIFRSRTARALLTLSPWMVSDAKSQNYPPIPKTWYETRSRRCGAVRCRCSAVGDVAAVAVFSNTWPKPQTPIGPRSRLTISNLQSLPINFQHRWRTTYKTITNTNLKNFKINQINDNSRI